VSTTISHVETITKKDLIIFYGGTKDISKNESKKGLLSLTDFARRSISTNVILFGVQHRHDLSFSSCANSEINWFNNKLLNLMSVFNHAKVLNIPTERLHHTNHGLHLSKKGKNWIVNNLVKEIKNLRPTEVSSTVLPWKDVHQTRPHQVHHTVSECQKTGDSVDVNIVAKPINEALTNINIVNTYGDSLVSASSSLKINTSCVGKTSAVTDVMGKPGKEASTNVVKDHGHSSESVDLLTTTVTNKNSQVVDHEGQLSGEITKLPENVTTCAIEGQLTSAINNLQENVTIRKSTRTKKIHL